MRGEHARPVRRAGRGNGPAETADTAPRSDPYTHFTRCKRVAYAIVDVVTRYWIGYLLTSEQTHTQVQLLFARAPEDQGCSAPMGCRSAATTRRVRSSSPGRTTVRR